MTNKSIQLSDYSFMLENKNKYNFNKKIQKIQNYH